MAILPPSTTRVQAPAGEGVGLDIPLPRRSPPSPVPDWPADWWQRNYDDVWDPDAPDPVPLTPRMQAIPPPKAGP